MAHRSTPVDSEQFDVVDDGHRVMSRVDGRMYPEILLDALGNGGSTFSYIKPNMK